MWAQHNTFAQKWDQYPISFFMASALSLFEIEIENEYFEEACVGRESLEID